MVILIGGASHTGKTFLAQRLLEKIYFPYFSVDHLKMGLIRGRQTNLTPNDDDALTNYLWSIVREIIKTVIENQQNLIIEDCYIPFNWRESFDEEYLSQIRFICLAMTAEYVENHFAEIKLHSSDIESRLDDTFCTPENLKADNKRIIEEYQAFGEQITLIDTNWNQTITNLIYETVRRNNFRLIANENPI